MQISARLDGFIQVLHVLALVLPENIPYFFFFSTEINGLCQQMHIGTKSVVVLHTAFALSVLFLCMSQPNTELFRMTLILLERTQINVSH